MVGDDRAGEKRDTRGRSDSATDLQGRLEVRIVTRLSGNECERI